MKSAILYVHAVSPLHAGTGQALDVIDLPIARERSTDLPYAPGSSLKGVFRAELRGTVDGEEVITLFGPETENAGQHAGASVFGDARLLLFPVRSAERLFCWVTSPYLLRRFLRDQAEAGAPPVVPVKALGSPEVEGTRSRVSDAGLLWSRSGTSKVFLHDADLPAEAASEVGELARQLARRFLPEGWGDVLAKRLVLVSDTQLGGAPHGAPAARDVAAARRQGRRRPGAVSARLGAAGRGGRGMTRTRDQERAAKAAGLVRAVESKGEALRKTYNALAHKLPVWLRTNGVLQTTAFLKDKAGDEQSPAHVLLLDHLADHLVAAGYLAGDADLLDELTSKDYAVYVRAQEEAVACAAASSGCPRPCCSGRTAWAAAATWAW